MSGTRVLAVAEPGAVHDSHVYQHGYPAAEIPPVGTGCVIGQAFYRAGAVEMHEGSRYFPLTKVATWTVAVTLDPIEASQ